MPAPPEIHTAGVVLWQWLLPVALLAVPLGAELTAGLLRKSPLHVSTEFAAKGMSHAQYFYHHALPQIWLQIRGSLLFLALLGASYLIALEDILDIPGAGRNAAHGLRENAQSIAAWAGLAAVAVMASLLVALLHRAFSRHSPPPPRTHAGSSAAWIEGALAIGMPKPVAWRRHVLPRGLRQTLSLFFETASWFVVWTMLISVPAGRGPGLALAAAADRALTDFAAPLAAGVVPALCALFLWLLGRIVAPRSFPQAHG
jgi:hypothetical protein